VALRTATTPAPAPSAASSGSALANLQGAVYKVATGAATTTTAGSSTDAGSRSVYLGMSRSEAVVPGQNSPAKAPTGKVPSSWAYTNPRSYVPSVPSATSNYGTVDADKIVTADDAVNSFWTWDDAQRKSFGDTLVSLGLATAADATRTPVLLSAWTDAVDAAANLYTYGKKRVTPWQALSGIAGIEGTTGKKGASGSGEARSYTTTSIDLTSPEAAKALISDTLSKYLGRAANDGEVSAFTTTLNNAQRANPTVTKTDVSADQNTTTSTTSGGLDSNAQAQIAKESAQANPNYAEYQAAGTYMNYLFSALQAPVKI